MIKHGTADIDAEDNVVPCKLAERWKLGPVRSQFIMARVSGWRPFSVSAGEVNCSNRKTSKEEQLIDNSLGATKLE